MSVSEREFPSGAARAVRRAWLRLVATPEDVEHFSPVDRTYNLYDELEKLLRAERVTTSWSEMLTRLDGLVDIISGDQVVS